MKIKNVTIPDKIVLAPMAGVTDKTFRLIAREYGCGLVYTEMISAKALTYKNIKTRALLDLKGEAPPIAVQLFGAEPGVMAEGAVIAQREGAQIIDINMGCPVPKVFKNGEGSALLEKPELACEIVRSMVSAVSLPVTVKVRSGLCRENIIAIKLAAKLEEAGASALAVHGRTRDQYYSGQADWQAIKEVKEVVSIPVIGNGDIWSPRDAKRMLEETGCDAVMLGRGVLGNPWLISNIKSFLAGQEIHLPTAKEKVHGAIRHLDLMIRIKGEEVAVRQMRKHIAWYLKGLAHTAGLKKNIFNAVTRAEVVEHLKEYLLNFC